ncbi:MAG: PKD domain-containing protein, partial [Methanosarcinaceae archaeon]|nr:PKD domain-containing protein [Methanosarcinaceae archaeon]
ASFTSNVTEGAVPLVVQFNDTSNDADSLLWNFGDGSTSTGQDPVHTYSSTGTYNVTLTATNTDGSDTATTTITVHGKNYYSGDRIWDENAGQSTTYTWDAKSFSGFFYDLESGLSSETMTIKDIDRSLGEGDIVYHTEPVVTDFDQSDWGSYEIIGFMAEKYFAAYTDDTEIEGVDTVSMMSSGQLSKILIDTDDKESVYSGSALILEEGYRLNIVEVDVNGDSVFVTLTKDGDELDSDVVSGGGDYIYKTDLGDSDDVVLIAVRFDEIFSGTESNAVFVEGIFQISDEYLELDDGESYGDMEVTSISSAMIEMENDGTVSLSRGDTINLMGKIKLIVADSDELRFAPFVDMSDPGTYELRGTVAEGSEKLTWTPLNFEGFYYDIDEGIRTETLELTAISGRTIPDDALVYTSIPASVEFEHSEWGKFNVIGFMAEKYFAGYNDDTEIDGIDSLSLISGGQLARVLLDEDDEISVYSGSSLILEEGYTLDIVEVDTSGDSVLVELSKDGDEVDTSIASANDEYIYEADVGDSEDVPVIIVHFNEVFRGSESNAVFIEGIFQISEDYLELESGDNYGEMEIYSFGSASIVMKNDGSIFLGSDDEISLMGDVGIRVADSDTLRYYPFVEVSTAPTDTLNVDLDRSVVIEDEDVTITVTARGAAISDATVKVDDVSIGKTDEEGTIIYTADHIGSLEIIAEKEGYTSGSEDLEVISPDDETKKIIIEVSPADVYEGTSATIFVLKAIGGDAVEGAEVTLDGKSIGSTSSDGTITYTMTDVGMHKLEALKSGYLNAELDLEVQELAAKFEFTNLRTSPLDVKAGEKATISVDVTNVGTAAGEYTVDLKVNGTVVGSQTISLDMDESTTIEFEHTEEEPGIYKVQVGTADKEYEVFEKSNTIWYVLGAIIIVAAGAIGYLFTAGGWTVEIAQAKLEEAIQAVQEFIGNLR